MDQRPGRQISGNQSEQRGEKNNLKKWDSLRSHWNNIKCSNICIIGIPEGEEREKRTLFKEITAENGLNLGKKTDSQAQGAERSKQDGPGGDAQGVS